MQQITVQNEAMFHRQLRIKRIDGIYMPPGRARRIAERLQKRQQRKRIEVKEVSYKYNPEPLDSYLVSSDYRREDVPALRKTESLRSAAMIPVIQYSRITRTSQVSLLDEWLQNARQDLAALSAWLSHAASKVDVSFKKISLAAHQLATGMVAVAAFYGSHIVSAYRSIKARIKPATSYTVSQGAVISRLGKIRGWLPVVLPSLALGVLFALFAGRNSTVPVDGSDIAPLPTESQSASTGSERNENGEPAGSSAPSNTSTTGTALPATGTMGVDSNSETNRTDPITAPSRPVGGYGGGSENPAAAESTETSSPDTSASDTSDDGSTSHDDTASPENNNETLLPDTTVTVPEQTVEVGDTTILETPEVEIGL